MNYLLPEKIAQLCLPSIEEIHPYLNRDVVIALKGLWPNLAGEVYLLQAQILLSARGNALSLITADLQNAYSALQQAIYFAKQHPQPKLMVGIHHLLGRLYSIQDKPQAAWEAQCQAIAYLENMRANLFLEVI